MALSDILSCPHFQVVAGRSPSLDDLNKLVDEKTSDWDDGRPSDQQQNAENQKFGEALEVENVVLRLWELFPKETDSSVSEADFKCFVKRCLRSLLPGLSHEQEEVVATNSWDEATGGQKGARLHYRCFLKHLTYFAKMWSDSREPADIAALLNELLMRITRVRGINPETGNELEFPQEIMISLEGRNGNLDWVPPASAFISHFTMTISGTGPSANISLAPTNNVLTTTSNYVWFAEAVCDPMENGDPSHYLHRVWAEIDDVLPVGRAALVAFNQVAAEIQHGCCSIPSDDTEETPTLVQARAFFSSKLAQPGSSSMSVLCTGSGSGKAMIPGSKDLFGLEHLLGVGLTEGNGSYQLVVGPSRGSLLYRLDRVREGALLPEPRAAVAASPTRNTGDGLLDKELKLPTFIDLITNKIEVDNSTGMVKPVEHESLIASGSLAALGEAYISSIHDNATCPAEEIQGSPIALSPDPDDTPQKTSPWIDGFPKFEESLCNDEKDLFTLAKTSPVALWVMGQCDDSGEYKTKVCWKFAERLGLEWLQPAHLVEVAAKTPPKYQTRLMANVAEQVHRELPVSLAQSLALTLEMMNSARCRTNGYVLDIPSLSPGDEEVVDAFAARVREISGAHEVRFKDLFNEDLVDLPPPPEPPAEIVEGEEAEGGPAGEGAEGGEAAEQAEGKENEDDENSAVKAEAEEANGGTGDAVEEVAAGEGDGIEGESEIAEAVIEIPPEPAPLETNPFTNIFPRRLIFLSVDLKSQDEVKAVRLQQLQDQLAAKQQRKKAMEEEGEEVPPEEEEEPAEEIEEIPLLPEDEEELDDMFAKSGGDILRVMAPYVPRRAKPKVPQPPNDEGTPPAEEGEAPPKEGTDENAQNDDQGETNENEQDQKPVEAAPPTEEPVPEDEEDPEPDPAVIMEIAQDVARNLRQVHGCPVLRLHADGRTPEDVVELAEVATADFQGLRAPMPAVLEAGADQPKDCLRTGLKDYQVGRRWSGWQQQCPVSINDKQLLPGDKDLAVDYAGKVFFFADVGKQRRFCMTPKRFLQDVPSINAPGMSLGYLVAGPCSHRCSELAAALATTYGFDVVDMNKMIAEAMELEAYDPPQEDADGEDQKKTRASILCLGAPRLYAAEKEAVTEGKPLSVEAKLRLVERALQIDGNSALIKQQREAIQQAKDELQAAEEASEEKPEHIVLDDDGQPVVPLAGYLKKPSRGFVLIGFPESAEQLQLLQEEARVPLERILLMKLLSEDAPEMLTFLSEQGYGDEETLTPLLEAEQANLEGLAGIDGLKAEEVPMDADEKNMVLHTRKLIDPFYPVVTDPAIALEIPDPDSWDYDEALAAATDEDGNVAEIPERPLIPWGICGSYCPVTLKEDMWLFPGQKEFQHVFDNRVFAVADEKASTDFQFEPSVYVSRDQEPEIPPPRILVTGPTGSSVQRQCQLLSDVYRIPVVNLEEEWLAEVETRTQEVKAEKQRLEKEEKAAERQRKWLEEREALVAQAEEEGTEMPPEEPPEPEEGEEEEGEEGEEEGDGGDGLDIEAREALFVRSMRTVLGSHRGACVIDGSFFNELSEEDEEIKAIRSLQPLLMKARRLPDMCVVLRCKNAFAFGQVHDVAAIDKEDENLIEIAKAQDAARLKQALNACELVGEERKAAFASFVEEMQGTEEDGPPDPLPDPPEDLIAPEEKESDRVKAKFVERKQVEQEILKVFTESMTAARMQPMRVSMDRGEGPAHKAIRWHCRPFMEQRASLLLRSQVAKVSANRTADLIGRGLATKSRLGIADPMKTDAPLFAGCSDAFKFGVEIRNRIYFPRNEADLEKLLDCPKNVFQSVLPGRVLIHPAIAVLGAPLSGKTTLAKQLNLKTGAVYLSVPEILDNISTGPVASALSRQIREEREARGSVTDETTVEAVRWRLAAADVLRAGWVLDDFPRTREQACLLENFGIVPQILVVLSETEALYRKRCAATTSAEDDDADPLLQVDKFERFKSETPPLRSFYCAKYGNVRDISGCLSTWAQVDSIAQEASAAVSQRLSYYRKVGLGQAAGVHGMCFPPQRVEANGTAWGKYCVVALTVCNELVLCSDPRFVVEYNEKFYWLSSEEYMNYFILDPTSFLQVPLPTAVPAQMTPTDRKTNLTFQLEEYCPVELVENKELVKSPGHHVVRFMNKFYSLSGKEALTKFMRRPMRYVHRAKLPAKRPPVKGEHQVSLVPALSKGRQSSGIEIADMLTFMQASVAELVCQALVEAGGKRPLYPGKTPRESALLFLSALIRARNSISTELFAKKVREELSEYLADCDLPGRLGQLSEDKVTMEEKGTWMSADVNMFKEMCKRFDEIFAL